MNFKHFNIPLAFFVVYNLALAFVVADGTKGDIKHYRYGRGAGLLETRGATADADGEDDQKKKKKDPLPNAGTCYKDTKICDSSGTGIILPSDSFWSGCLSVYVNVNSGYVCHSCTPKDKSKECFRFSKSHGKCLELNGNDKDVSGCFLEVALVSCGGAC